MGQYQRLLPPLLSLSKPRHTLSSSMRQILLLLAFLGLSKASLFQARSGHWELCQYQKDTNGRYQLGSCVPSGSCDSAQQLEGENSVAEVEIWKTVVSTISRSGKVVKTVRYKVEQCSSDPRYPEQENLIADSKTFDRKICSNTAYHTDEYLVRDPKDCQRFFSCQRTLGAGGWVARHMSCAPGTHFDGARCQAGEDCVNQLHSGTSDKTNQDTTTETFRSTAVTAETTKITPANTNTTISITTTTQSPTTTTSTTTSTSTTTTTASTTTRAPATTTTIIPTTTTTTLPTTTTTTTTTSTTTTTTTSSRTTTTSTTTTTTSTTTTTTVTTTSTPTTITTRAPATKEMTPT